MKNMKILIAVLVVIAAGWYGSSLIFEEKAKDVNYYKYHLKEAVLVILECRKTIKSGKSISQTYANNCENAKIACRRCFWKKTTNDYSTPKKEIMDGSVKTLSEYEAWWEQGKIKKPN